MVMPFTTIPMQSMIIWMQLVVSLRTMFRACMALFLLCSRRSSLISSS